MKILSMTIENHPYLNDLKLDFTDKQGNPVNNIILAGENGCGKTTILDLLYYFNEDFNDCDIEPPSDDPYRVLNNIKIAFFVELNEPIAQYINPDFQVRIKDDIKVKYIGYTFEKKEIRSFKEIALYDKNKNLLAEPYESNMKNNSIYLTPEITFKPMDINAITTKTIDYYQGGRKKSNNDIATAITQLIIDIDNQDNCDFRELYDNEPLATYTKEQQNKRITRFNNAFKQISDLSIIKIVNYNGIKQVQFSNQGYTVPIESLSTGEKQIVFRGGFLLQNKNSMHGAYVLIDEPEISLHPDWQKKIADFYKTIFKDKNGVQTSQIFFATHSPFVVHSENRADEKVIVLKRDESGKIIVDNNPNYYLFDRKAAIESAFNMTFKPELQPTVYLEGRTDEMYFNRALKVINYNEIPFLFKWVGYIDENNGQEVNTGKDALSRANQFLIANNYGIKYVLLFDNDTNRGNEERNNVYIRTMPYYENRKKMNKGIENALILDSIDTTPFYTRQEKDCDYGGSKTFIEFDKMRFCEYICGKKDEELRVIFANLKTQIDELVILFNY